MTLQMNTGAVTAPLPPPLNILVSNITAYPVKEGNSNAMNFTQYLHLFCMYTYLYRVHVLVLYVHPCADWTATSATMYIIYQLLCQKKGNSKAMNFNLYVHVYICSGTAGLSDPTMNFFHAHYTLCMWPDVFLYCLSSFFGNLLLLCASGVMNS